MKSKPNSLAWSLAICLLATLLACGTRVVAQPPGLSSFAVTATDKSHALDTFPTTAVEAHLSIQAIDKQGQPDTSYAGVAALYVTPGIILTGTGSNGQFSVASTTNLDFPTLTFSAGQAEVDVWVKQVFGETYFWVEDRSGTDAGAGTTLLATGVSNPLRYAFPLLQDTQITNDNTTSPLNGAQVTLDESQPRCLAPTGDGGACDPNKLYTMDMIVTGVGSDHFTVLDRNAFDPDSGVPYPGLDPGTGKTDLPGSWASMFVYTYSEPTLFVGDRISSLSGTLQEFDGDTQLNFPSYTLNPDSRYSLPRPQDLPPPVPIDPGWCPPRDSNDQPSDGILCETATSDVHLESLESALISLRDATIPSRWLSCDLAGNGSIPYRNSNGCMPQTGGNFCYADGGGAGAICPSGEQCIDDECLAVCSSSAECQTSDHEACIDGHCMNPCMCRQYCDADPTCAELYQYNAYGQYTVVFPGDGGGLWKFGALTKTGVASFNPYTHPGMVVDFLNGTLSQVRASDPMWVIEPRVNQDMCCHANSPGCDADAGVVICPQHTSQ